MSSGTLPVRTTDPDTFYEAACKAVLRGSKIRPVVLDLLKENGPLTHDELISAYHMRVVMEPDTPRASDSGIRTRLSELRRAGLVRKCEDSGTSSYGNRAYKWEAVDPDDVTAVGSPYPAPVAALIGQDDVVAVADGDEG